MDWGNLLLGIAGVAGAPFTGGASLALTGRAIAAHAAKSAADKQSTSADKALAELGRVHGQQINRLNPFISPGLAAYQRIGVLMGGAPAPMGGGMSPDGRPAGQSAGPVQMRAPNGELKLVPAALVSHYQQQGATIAHDSADVAQLGQQDQQIRAWLQSKGLPMPTPHPSGANATSFPMPQGGQ